MTRDTAVHELLAGALDGSGVVLEEVTVTPAGRRRVVKVVVDRALDGTGDVTETIDSLTLDEIADTTRTVSDVLDESDVLGEQPYTLEVTSRGVDRPLTLPRHWRRNADRLVKVTLTDGSSLTGRILSSTEESVTLDVSGKQREVAYADVAKALVQIEFNRKSED